MKLIVGLGNPGAEYEHTRHNVGFVVIDSFTQGQRLLFDKLYQSDILRLDINGQSILCVKPQTFMNNSGMSVAKLVKNMKVNLNDLIVIHDDITIPFGELKISKGIGAGKHNGVQSIIDLLHDNEFIRVRLGIGRGNGILKDVVLSKFTKDEQTKIDKLIQIAKDAVNDIILYGIEHTMNAYNQKD